MKRTISSAAAVILILGLAKAAFADTCTFNPGGSIGVWDSAGNWEDCSGEYPNALDTAIISSGKTCRIENGDAESAYVLQVNSGGTLQLEGSAQLTLNDEDGTMTINGDIVFVKPNGGDDCDPGDPPSTLGKLYLARDMIFANSGTNNGVIEGGCYSSGGISYYPGVISGANGVALTLDKDSTGTLTLKNSLRFDVPVTMTDGPNFLVDEDDSVMEFNQPTSGLGYFLTRDGKLQSDACMTITGGGTLDMGSQSTPSNPTLEINAQTCEEGGTFQVDDGTVNVNADLYVMQAFILGPHCIYESSECPTFGPIEINVADGAVFSLPRSGASCPSCP